MTHTIKAPSHDLRSDLQRKIDQKTKPLGALGRLEELALQLGLAQGTETPTISNPELIVFAADHGIAQEGVSAYPQEVTYQMVLNFLSGGAAINIFCAQNDCGLSIVDAGVIGDFEPNESLIDAKIAHGTASFLSSPAMSKEQCDRAINVGRDLAKKKIEAGTNLLGFGEMGIGNTSSASVLMHLLTNIPLDQCIGSGTGLDPTGIEKKYRILSEALASRTAPQSPIEVLQNFGGFEIAMICGACIGAAEAGSLFLVDGFIASAAFLAAQALAPEITPYAIFSHRSNEKGHAQLLDYLKAKPLLDLDLRLGEGTGCALALPLVRSAARFLSDMASFDSAGVSDKN
ncbi:MAG: nicotinate-nucleotide--dimethylbenzimidazole phosphoribosyltransferase [Verrucomicrobiota bacterium]